MSVKELPKELRKIEGLKGEETASGYKNRRW